MGLLDGVGTQVTLRRYIQRFDLSRWQNMIQSSKVGFRSQLNPNKVPNSGHLAAYNVHNESSPTYSVIRPFSVANDAPK